MKDKIFLPGETIKADVSGAGIIQDVKFSLYVNDNFAEVIHDGTYRYIPIDRLKKLEENKMKHSCGKVFDVTRKFLITVFSQKIKNFIVWEDRIIVVCENGETSIYNLCGHLRGNCHIDAGGDLVNVPEQEEERKEVDIELAKSKLIDLCEILELGNFFNILKADGLIGIVKSVIEILDK